VILVGVGLLSGLDPDSLFLDDQWVGIALRDAGLGERIGLHLPMPLGFAALAGLPGLLVRDPDVALQIVPALAYLASLALFPVLIYRLSDNAWAAALGTAMLASAPLTAAFAVRVKHYTLDQLVTVGVLLVMIELFRPGSARRFLAWTLALALGVVLSFSSVFLAVVAIATTAVTRRVGGWEGHRERTEVTVIASLFLVSVAAFFGLFVRRASRPIMVEFWNDYFPVFDGWSGVSTFLSERVSAFLLFAMPPWAGLLVFLMPFGFVWLWRSGHRAYCIALALFYGAVLAAAAVRAYPMGTGRTDIYSFAVTTLLICLGAVWVLDLVASRFVRNGVYAGAMLLLVASILLSPGAEYPSTDDRAVVEWTQERLGGGDALVLSPYAVFALKYFAAGPAELVPAEYYGHGFDVVPSRPLTYTTSVGRWDLGDPAATDAELGRLRDFLSDAPARLVYLETYGVPDGRGRVLNTIVEQGYGLVERTDFGRVAEAFLFERAGVGPATAGSAGSAPPGT